MMGGAQLSTGPPRRGELIRDFVLQGPGGEPVQLSDYRGRRNLVLILAAGKQRDLLKQLAQRQNSLEGEQATILAIVAGPPSDAARLKDQEHLPFPVLDDADGLVHAGLGARDGNGNLAPALYVTDRFGEVFAAFRAAEAQALPDADEVLRWLEFVNEQCEECNPPEWPAVG